MSVLRAPPAIAAHVSFAAHVVAGTASFCFVYGVALLASAGLKRLDVVLHAPAWLSTAGGFVEAAIFLGDVVGLALLICYELAKLSRRLRVEWRSPHG